MNVPADSFTGAIVAGRRAEGTFINASKQGDQRLDGYEVYFEPSGRQAISISRRTRPVRSAEAPKKAKKTAISQHTPEIVNRLIASARKSAAEMLASAESNEPMELANNGFELLDALIKLWHERQHREPDWGDMVNLLRSALTRIEFEKLSRDQCGVICRFIDECLGSGRVDRADHQLSLRLLRKAGLDPWRAISEPAK